MLKSYEVTILNGQIQWQEDPPNVDAVKAIITIVEELPKSSPKRSTPHHLVGKIKTLVDIVSPIVDEDDWECLK
jgi:hypothetical protein